MAKRMTYRDLQKEVRREIAYANRLPKKKIQVAHNHLQRMVGFFEGICWCAGWKQEKSTATLKKAIDKLGVKVVST